MCDLLAGFQSLITNASSLCRYGAGGSDDDDADLPTDMNHVDDKKVGLHSLPGVRFVAWTIDTGCHHQ
jgi:hypothetical protein